MSFRLIEPSASRAWSCWAQLAATATVAELLSEPDFTVTMQLDVLVGAVSTPAVVIVPALVVQVSAGMVVIDLPNWSTPEATNCWVPPGATVDTPAERESPESV